MALCTPNNSWADRSPKRSVMSVDPFISLNNKVTVPSGDTVLGIPDGLLDIDAGGSLTLDAL
jgi:hypothetical protein